MRRLVLKKTPDFFDLPAFLGGAVKRAVALVEEALPGCIE